MAKIFYQEDCNLSLLDGQTIAIIGYGSQGHAHALNAKESGCHVIIGLYEGSKSWKRAEEQGWIQHPFQPDRSAEERRCYHDRAESSGSYCKKRVSGRKRNSVSGSCTSGCNRKSSGESTCLRSCNRRRKSGYSGDNLPY